MTDAHPETGPRQRHHGTNWPEYNRTLIDRGSLTLWVDEAIITGWRASCGRGRVYSDVAILCALSLKAVFSLTLRAAQGLLESLKQMWSLSHPRS